MVYTLPIFISIFTAIAEDTWRPLEYYYNDKDGKCYQDIGPIDREAYGPVDTMKLDTYTSLECADFSKRDLRDRTLKQTKLKGANFEYATLYKTTFSENTDLSDSNFSGSIINSAIFREGTDLSNTDFRGSKITHSGSNITDFTGTTLTNAWFGDSTIINAHFSEAKMGRAQLNGIHCEACNFEKANLSGSNIMGATIGKNTEGQASSLKNARLDGSYMNNDTLFHATQMERASFTEAKVNGATFTDVNCINCNFYGATFGKAALAGNSDFLGTNFSNADLSSAVIDKTVNLKGAYFDTTTQLPQGWTIQTAIKRGMIPVINGNPAEPNEIQKLLSGKANLDSLEYDASRAEVYDGSNKSLPDSTSSESSSSGSTKSSGSKAR